MASRSKEVGRVQFTCTLPLNTGIQVYNFAEKMDCGANKVLQELIAYAVKHAHCRKVNRGAIALVFDDDNKNEEE